MMNLKFHLIILMFNIKSALKNELGKDASSRVIGKMIIYFKEINQRQSKEKGIMGFHKMLLIIGLSLYYAMQDELENQDDLVEKIHKIFWRSRTRDLIRVIAFFVRHSKNPFSLYLRLLGPRNEFFFPCPPWEKTDVELENGVGWHQHKCPYYEFFKSEGVVELTRAYCDIDKRVAELVSNHIELKRQHTLAKGDEWCDFYYYKK